MKKIMFMAAALLTFAGCAEKEVDTPEEPDSISLSPKSEHVVPGKGGDVSVMVNSSTDWVLEGEHGLVEPSALSGSDEDVVTFTVKANLGEETAAEFTFVAGKATAPLTIKILKADAVLDELTLSAANHEFGVGGDEFSITVTQFTGLDCRSKG